MGKPTEKQIALLAKWGQFTPGMTFEDASRIIGEKLGNSQPQASYQPAPKVEEKPDWDKITEGKIRSLFLQAKIQKDGLVQLTERELEVLNLMVKIAMNGSAK